MMYEEGEEEVGGQEEQEERVKVKQEILDEYEDSLRVIAAYQSYIETIRNRASAFFRNKLIDAISSPFNHSEYDKLIVQARKRTPQAKLKHLRSDSIPYKTKIPGSLYFDYFPDLAKEAEQADCYKGLALMRGFFFWLKDHFIRGRVSLLLVRDRLQDQHSTPSTSRSHRRWKGGKRGEYID